MIKLDEEFLGEVSLGDLVPLQANTILRQTYKTLESRVGIVLSGRMTDTQLDEFSEFLQDKDESGALRWLEDNLPDYREVVAEELHVLKAEIIAAGADIRTLLDEFLPSEPSTEEAPGDG